MALGVKRMPLGAKCGGLGGFSVAVDNPLPVPRTPAKPYPRGSFVQYFPDLGFTPQRAILGGPDLSGFGYSRYGEGVASGRHHWTYVYRGVYRGVRMEGR